MYLILAVLLCSLYGFYIGRKKSLSLVKKEDIKNLNSKPNYHGYYIFFWCLIPSIIIYITFSISGNILIKSIVLNLVPNINEMSQTNIKFVYDQIQSMATGTADAFYTDEKLRPAANKYNSLKNMANISFFVVILCFLSTSIIFLKKKIQINFPARMKVEKFFSYALLFSSVIAIFTTIGIVLSLLFESIRFFKSIPFFDFIFGLHWSPQIAIREDQVGSSGAFGSVPLISGTLLITFIAMVISVPVGLFSAIYLSDYAPKKIRNIAKPLLEILAGIPTVVYGFFAALTIGPILRTFGDSIGLDISDNVNFESDSFPIESSSIDIVTATSVIEHLYSPANFMSEIWRILKPGSVVILVCPNWRYSFKSYFNDPTHVHPYTEVSLSRLFKSFNFENEYIVPWLVKKPAWMWDVPKAFFIAKWFIPFRGSSYRWIPEFLKGSSSSILAMALKPQCEEE